MRYSPSKACCPDCQPPCNGDYFSEDFEPVIESGWTESESNFELLAVLGKGELRRNFGGDTGTRVDRLFDDGTPSKIVMACTVFEVVTNGEAAGIGWDPIVGDKFYKFMLAINWQTSKVIIYHNGTPTSVNITPGASHNLHMVLEQIDSTTVRSRFCVDGEAVGAASYDDTYKLANLTKYGLHGEAQGTPELEKIAEYDDFCLDVDFIAVCGTHCDADTTPDEMDVILAGYVSNGPDGCPDCTIWNDTYRLQKSAACKWEGEFEPTGSSGCKNLWIEAEIAANTLRVTLDHDLASPTNSQAIFEKTVTTPIDCATINDSLTLASSQDPIAECQSAGETPQVITVTMQSV